MIRPFATSAVILALALASSEPVLAQSRAERQSMGAERGSNGVVMGLAALAVLGLAIHAAQDDDDDKKDERPRVPARCLVDWPTHDGAVALYDADCLDLEYRAASRLPLDCAVTVRSHGRFVSGFSPDCLREEGWRLQRD
ncbi:hypothetical protein FHG66_09635 [Rubellimicrobium rubrum]|uniref:Uncharacterized protein n=1 Tax=Rubellimicrobium rubrum TaxID=2585369 RepID=A0A5C4N0K3_9RHOB|nr:hypothetical protein [Rubellimicrobium rubrum]TNC49772.1 hypothetical protein FHG66_09635 [Rubellimicrobium rubrum]